MIFLLIRKSLEDLFDNFYDSRPMEETRYPLVFLGEEFKLNNRQSKDYLNKETTLTIHFYHNDIKKRGTIKRMMNTTEKSLYKYSENIGQRIINEVSKEIEFIHGVLEITINH